MNSARAQPAKVVIRGRPLNCLVCGSDDFIHKRIALKSPLRSLLRLGWLNDSSDVAVCDRCGYVHTFIL